MIPGSAFYTKVSTVSNGAASKSPVFTDSQYALLLLSDYNVNHGHNLIPLPANKMDRYQPVHTDYYILNLVGSLDCIDMEKSEYRMGRIVKDRIKRIKNLVLDEDKIPAEAKIFRLVHKPDEYIVSDEVRKAFEENGIANFRLLEAQGWGGLDI